MTTYYVSSSTGSNSGNGTSAGSALQTLQAAANLTKPGDTVIVASGTYAPLMINTSGTAGALITYQAAPGATPTITVPSSSWSGINVNASYIVVQGFHVQGDAQTMTVAQANSLGATSATTANGIDIGDSISSVVSHVSIVNNTVSYMPGGGIQADYADYVTVQGNTVFGNANFSPWGESGISIYASQNSDNSTVVKNFIVGNTVYNNAELVIEKATGRISDGEGIIIDDNSNDQTNGKQYTGGTLVENNLAFKNGSIGILAYSSSNVQMLYNTTYQNGTVGVNQAEMATIAATNAVVENNIMYAASGGLTEMNSGSSGTTANYNDLFGGSTSMVNGSNTITGNPLFVNAGAGNFQTSAGSPAIGAANSAFPNATDIAGNSRPSSGAEIGAYQSTLTPTPTPTQSANDTVVKAGSTAAITDAAGNHWTITSGGQIAVNGVVDPITARVTELAYVNGMVWQENASNLWWGKTSPTASWSPAGGIATSPLPATPVASPNDTMLLAGAAGAITDASGNQWTITGGAQIAVNGIVDPITARVTELAYINGKVWQENASNLWWGKTSPTESWAPNAGTSVNPLPAPIVIASGTASSTVTQSQISAVATAGNHILFLSGSGDIVSLSGGAETITDTGHGNTYILPAAGKGSDTFTGTATANILTVGDTLDLKSALAATNWNGAASTVSDYLKVTDSAAGATLSIAPTSGGAGVMIASINGATTLNLTSLLTHAII